MTQIDGLVGFRPALDAVEKVTLPPYDVIKSGSPLDTLLASNKDSLYRVTMGDSPKESLDDLVANGMLISDDEPSFYVYEQSFDGGQRNGVFTATKVSDYSEKQVIRHEKTFDEKVAGRIALTNKIEHTIGPIFLLTVSPISEVIEKVKSESEPIYEFTSDFNGNNDLDGIKNRVFKVPADSENGQKFIELVGEEPLYIADGHHRYHAALKNNQTHALAYIVEKAHIQAYNRVVTGKVDFESIKDKLDLVPVDEFETPKRHAFCIYTKNGSYVLNAKTVPEDVVGKLDCSILEKELYPLLGLDHSMIIDPNHFDYYAESELDVMKECVDTGKYDIAIALHPVSTEDLMSVADAGLEDSNVVMPEKSTFFAPKILTGIFVYKHSFK